MATFTTLNVDCSCCEPPADDDTTNGFDILLIDCDCPCCDVPDEPEDPVEPTTSFDEMYSFFLAGITDDMFMEMTKEDTEDLLEEILLAALPHFEFPHKDIFDTDLIEKKFNVELNLEEKMIIRQYMIVEWIGYQLASIENIRQKYSGLIEKFGPYLGKNGNAEMPIRAEVLI